TPLSSLSLHSAHHIPKLHSFPTRRSSDLKKAIELDPRFALARSNLAVSYYNLNQNALAADSIRQAFELADRQTVRDRLHIITLYYDLGTGDVQKAIQSYKQWVELYPRDDIARGNLASEYFL